MTMGWQPIALALLLGLLVAIAIYAAMRWPATTAEPPRAPDAAPDAEPR